MLIPVKIDFGTFPLYWTRITSLNTLFLHIINLSKHLSNSSVHLLNLCVHIINWTEFLFRARQNPYIS